MNEKPIVFSPTMVKAILDGGKTQTRRFIKKQPPYWIRSMNWIETGDADIKCPYEIGDILWVKEDHAFCDREILGYDVDEPCHVVYKSDQKVVYHDVNGHRYLDANLISDSIRKWRHAMYMPKWASRIRLKINNLRAERVQDISPEDCISEGIYETNDGAYTFPESGFRALSPVDSFKWLWNGVHLKADRKWDDNPWVWVVEFEVEK